MNSVKLSIPAVKADTFWRRFIGFMFKSARTMLFYLLIVNLCRLFVYFDLDTVYLDKENNVIKVIRSLKPPRIV
ncbi:MAG: DUF192 domain-containing protein [Endomicrobium sp.]|jgi:uncharacterized membrane protein (UPF0127 family)|nr:DUF192 domain-containing protein [Endomicrobium sp.]